MRGRFGPPPPDGGPRLQRGDRTGPRSGRPTLPGPETELVTLDPGVRRPSPRPPAPVHGSSPLRLEQLVTGLGDPVTVFAHGLAGDISGTRPLGSAVTGRRVFFHFRGHGRSDAPPGPWSFGDLAGDLRGVADLAGATRAVGVSMGAGALCRLLAETPDRFERIVLYLPAPLDGSRPEAALRRLDRLLASVESGEAAMIADAVEAEIPAAVRNTPAGWGFLRQRVDQLQRDGLAAELSTLWSAPPLPDESLLKAFRGRALVIGCQGDEIHPVAGAERVAGLLDADLHVYDRPSILWTDRADLRERISAFLNA
ncbi:alpha/beta hydrolase [Actinoplanes sp. SE50]|uniref:alpha/beta fold hydrolase n=1 Tax=unclassified Actinoplanes TaxID=2626549 RepID=UPI00023EDF27|nr:MULTISPECIES: alpha/beta hydrolase [unclassified Actinoplanes]AEV88824.1 alpha/beta hydrolase fold protein [Actinoplanes sp. SE50/110]ATO87230.1 alpha/beta hydrolase [Actinoplanes sp. SE50]SLM04648.1 alpha/beta hydrolase [Actinoplanes sp. SE50/110]